jgi:thiol-disulfide isomerase/thioredoxin
VLVEFWTYTCYNCQNAQPHINALYDKYRDDGLLVVGIHSPEFGFEKDISIVRKAVGQANIEYPVVLDNNYAIWNVSGRHGTSSTPTDLSPTGISERAPTTRQSRRCRSCYLRGTALRADPGNPALSWLPQDGIIGEAIRWCAVREPPSYKLPLTAETPTAPRDSGPASPPHLPIPHRRRHRAGVSHLPPS